MNSISISTMRLMKEFDELAKKTESGFVPFSSIRTISHDDTKEASMNENRGIDYGRSVVYDDRNNNRIVSEMTMEAGQPKIARYYDENDAIYYAEVRSCRWGAPDEEYVSITFEDDDENNEIVIERGEWRFS